MTLETWTEFSARWPQDQSQQERAAGNWARMAAAQGIDPFGDLPESLHAAARAVMERNARARKIRMPAGRSRSAGSRSARTARRATGTPVAYEHSEDAVDGADALDGLTRPADIAPVIQELAQRHGVTIDSPVPYTREEHAEMTRRPRNLTAKAGRIVTLSDGRRLWAIRERVEWDEDQQTLHESVWGPIVMTA